VKRRGLTRATSPLSSTRGQVEPARRTCKLIKGPDLAALCPQIARSLAHLPMETLGGRDSNPLLQGAGVASPQQTVGWSQLKSPNWSTDWSTDTSLAGWMLAGDRIYSRAPDFTTHFIGRHTASESRSFGSTVFGSLPLPQGQARSPRRCEPSPMNTRSPSQSQMRLEKETR